MRIRHKKWARPELEASSFFVPDAREYKGKWKARFETEAPLHIELGCGKGGFIAVLAAGHPEINYVAVDMKDDMLGVARRKIDKEYSERGREVKNLLITPYDIERIDDVFSEDDVADRIYINFCNPWPRHAYNKKRLTHTRQLMKYRGFLRDGGEIRFKTDDDGLFKDSLKYFEESGFEITYVTCDLHSENLPDNIITEHETMFSEEGIKIKYLVAVKRPL